MVATELNINAPITAKRARIALAWETWNEEGENGDVDRMHVSFL